MHLSSRAASGRGTTLAQVGTHSESCYVLVVTLGKFQEHGAGWDRMLSRALIFSQQSWQGKAEPGQVHIFLCFTGTLSHIRDCTGRWAGCLRGKVSRRLGCSLVLPNISLRAFWAEPPMVLESVQRSE